MLKRMATLLGGSLAGQLVTIAAAFVLTRIAKKLEVGTRHEGLLSASGQHDAAGRLVVWCVEPLANVGDRCAQFGRQCSVDGVA